MNILYAMLGGFALDWIFGDPAWLTHPVVIMGRAIVALESGLRKRLPQTPRGERLAGLTMAIVLPVGTLLLTGGVCRALAAVHQALGFAAELLWCAQALAATGLAQESTNVYRQLEKDDLPAARKAVRNEPSEGSGKAAGVAGAPCAGGERHRRGAGAAAHRVSPENLGIGKNPGNSGKIPPPGEPSVPRRQAVRRLRFLAHGL